MTTQVTTTQTTTEPIHANRIGITSHDMGRTTRYYYTTGELTNCYQSSGIYSAESLSEYTDEATRQFVETVLAITGVEKISWLESNRLILHINPMYLWDEIQDQVIAAIYVRLGWEADNTSVLSYDDFQEVARRHDAASMPANRLV